MDIECLLREDARGMAVGKVRPRRVVMPSDLGRQRDPPGGGKPIVWVDIRTGEILAFNWPLEENMERNDK